ncbi:uncharacterized protein SPAPADRAFT_63822 [Spathaspora passalidarum NRRL Y-27907]|uniref:Threonylcarbamoyl-AMP synthase n=1 Tax=Spathaspora passalidarum (strain NRRL Y-27907 / 11-Y1) TaxID=619300 RepID=G3AVP4_SPAPN|nr:uncharacterized protein SPAPADRAFT_63822 [Spathaspora passalidarum NRRL Y-27907]EGW30209.1 hypothetical protein SPAPADRAFT_63822 [Spathaspora passalidarum NRRL Y-27907]
MTSPPPTFVTKVLKVKPESISFKPGNLLPTITDRKTQENLNLAAHELTTTNNAIGFPTETVYGLAGSALDDESVKSIYRAKNRPSDNPLIVHISSRDQLSRKLNCQEIPSIYHKLIDEFWPGPLTILLPVDEKTNISNLVTANQNTFAVRMPSHPVARALIAISDTPIAAPSANASTRPSPTMAEHVYHDLQGRIPLVLDGGNCKVGVESTVIDGLCNPPMLLRPGGVSLEQIKQVGGKEWENIIRAKKTAGKNEVVRTPGMKYRHYSPTAKVVLFVNCQDGNTAISKYITKHQLQGKKIALLRSKYFEINENELGIRVVRDLGTKASDVSFNLFKLLREVDELNVDVILVEGIEEDNEGLAVMNRLSKAAVETIDGENM